LGFSFLTNELILHALPIGATRHTAGDRRPVARPHFGGHIERLIGTLMGPVHLLPGSTDASPHARGGYDSEREARLTLPEFCDVNVLIALLDSDHTLHEGKEVYVGKLPWAMDSRRVNPRYQRGNAP
jgi:hypothetical protein